MKVLHITETYAPAGGTELYVLNLVSLLERHGHQNAVIYRQAHPQTPKGGNARSYLVAREGRLPDERHAIRQLVVGEKPDVAMLHVVGDPEVISDVAGLVPSVGYVHNFLPVCPGLVKFFRRGDDVCRRPFGLGCVPAIYLRRCSSARHPRTVYRIMRATRAHQAAYRSLNHGSTSRIVVGSTYMRDMLAQNGFDATGVDVLPPHFEEPRPAAEPQRDPPLVLFSGRLEIEKGFPYLLKALARVRPPCRLLVAGDGTCRDVYEALAHELGVAHRVDWLGWLDAASLGRVYQSATLLAMPSVWPEPFGKVGVEALAHGRPVVAFNVGGIPDWLQDGVNGFLVPSRDIGQLVARIDQLLGDTALIRQLGANGRSYVERDYAPDRYLGQLGRIFDKVLG